MQVGAVSRLGVWHWSLPASLAVLLRCKRKMSLISSSRRDPLFPIRQSFSSRVSCNWKSATTQTFEPPAYINNKTCQWHYVLELVDDCCSNSMKTVRVLRV